MPSETDPMSWTEDQIQAVWETGAIVPNFRPDKWRKDACGAWISRDRYDDRESDFGWQIGEITSLKAGKVEEPPMLLPLHCRNREASAGGRLSCPVMAFAGGNVDRSGR